MSDLFRKISDALRKIRNRARRSGPADRRKAPRFILSSPVLWEVGPLRGEGRLREISSSGLKLVTDRALLAGKIIRLRPAPSAGATPLAVDVVIGSVAYSRLKDGRFEVGVELVCPERISRYAWIAQLAGAKSGRERPARPATRPALRLVCGGSGAEKAPLLRSPFRQPGQGEKNSKK